MQHKDIQAIAIVYGKKELVEEFIDQFQMDRAHDQAPINAIQLKGEMKKEMKKWLWKGD